jgi:hypothetical protein
MKRVCGRMAGWAALVLALCGCVAARADVAAQQRAYGFIAGMMDRYQGNYDVYTDAGSAGNHFFAMGMMPDEEAKVAMDMMSTATPKSGATCIRCSFKPGKPGWGGFYFMNGVLREKATAPDLNWGTEPDAGVDLSGAESITFWARGAKGGERVQFFVGGIGWKSDHRGNSVEPDSAYPDSLPKVSTGYITLSTEWKQYSINVRGRNLRNILGGFGWATDGQRNRNQPVTFYLDDIAWNRQPSDNLRLALSYETEPKAEGFDAVMKSVAFTYDNAVALLSLLARGTEDDLRRANILASGLSYAIRNDRFYSDRRIRNAYAGGDLANAPGWKPNGRSKAARLPVFIDQKTGATVEDRTMVGTYAGNVAWTMIALTAAYQKLGDVKYRVAAESLGMWVEQHCRDNKGPGGYTGGYEGWENQTQKLTWKSTEHNIDLYVAFTRLHQATKEERWRLRAKHARRFVEAMWDGSEGKFWTGTTDDGVHPDRSIVPVDVQAWAVLALKDKREVYSRALDYAERHAGNGGGYDFNTDRDGIWYEGTAHMAAAYHEIGRQDKAKKLIAAIESAQTNTGAIPSASTDGLSTGLGAVTEDGSNAVSYYRRGHVGATAWYLLAKVGANPFWMQ